MRRYRQASACGGTYRLIQIVGICKSDLLALFEGTHEYNWNGLQIRIASQEFSGLLTICAIQL